MAEIVVDEMIGRGLRYSEEVGREYRSLPSHDCYLWKDGVDKPVSGLNLVSLRQRFWGYISFEDLLNAGLVINEGFERIGYAWFGELRRNAAYVHRLDRY